MAPGLSELASAEADGLSGIVPTPRIHDPSAISLDSKPAFSYLGDSFGTHQKEVLTAPGLVAHKPL